MPIFRRGWASAKGSTQRKPEQFPELAERRVGIADPDGRHPEGARRLQVRADVVEHDGLGRRDAELGAGELVDTRVWLPHSRNRRLDEGVEVRAEHARALVL